MLLNCILVALLWIRWISLFIVNVYFGKQCFSQNNNFCTMKPQLTVFLFMILSYLYFESQILASSLSKPSLLPLVSGELLPGKPRRDAEVLSRILLWNHQHFIFNSTRYRCSGTIGAVINQFYFIFRRRWHNYINHSLLVKFNLADYFFVDLHFTCVKFDYILHEIICV